MPRWTSLKHLRNLHIKENSLNLNIQSEDLQALPNRRKTRQKNEAATPPYDDMKTTK